MTDTAVPDGGTYDPAVPIERIKPNPHQPRKEVKNIEGLAANIKEFGVIHPLALLRAEDGSGDYWIEAGHRRVEAARKAGLTTVPARIAPPRATPEQIMRMLSENGPREGLSAVEEGEAIQQVLGLKGPWKTQKSVAGALGMSPQVVSARVKLTKLPDDVREQVHRGQIPLEAAGELADLAEEPDLQEELLKTVGTHNWDWKLRSVKEERGLRRQREKAVKEIKEAGWTLVEEVPDDRFTGPAALGWLESSDPERQKKGQGMTVEEHGECPHRAAVAAMVYQAGEKSIQAVPLCLDPDAAGHERRYKYPDDAAARPSAPRPVDEAERRAEAERWEEEHREREAKRNRARSLRIDFLAKTPFKDKAVLTGALRLYLSYAIPEYLAQKAVAGSYRETTIQDCEDLARIFKVELPKAEQKSKGTRAQQMRDEEAARGSWHVFRPAVENARQEQCVQALLSMYRREAEYQLEHGVMDDEGHGRHYLRWLTDQGYQMSDEEIAMVAEQERRGEERKAFLARRDAGEDQEADLERDEQGRVLVDQDVHGECDEYCGEHAPDCDGMCDHLYVEGEHRNACTADAAEGMVGDDPGPDRSAIPDAELDVGDEEEEIAQSHSSQGSGAEEPGDSEEVVPLGPAVGSEWNAPNSGGPEAGQ